MIKKLPILFNVDFHIDCNYEENIGNEHVQRIFILT